MAKSSGFFTLRSGSTKSLTFQTYRGKQITKDRVSKVANPQSTSQMEQRLRLAVIARYRAALKGLVDHSFQSVDYGWKSLQHFSSINMAKGAGVISCYVPKGCQQMGVGAITVSEGSLTAPDVVIPNMKSAQIGYNLLPDAVTFSATATTVEAKRKEAAEAIVKSILSQNEDLQEGDQITLLFQMMMAVERVKWNSTTFMVPASRFYISRIILNADDLAASDWITKQDIKADSTSLDLSQGWSNGVFKLTATATTYEVGFEGPSAGDNIGQFLAGTVILSRKSGNVWQRSTSYLGVTDNVDDILGNFLSYEDVVPTYLKSSSSSNRYLNEGDDSTAISGEDSSGKTQG